MSGTIYFVGKQEEVGHQVRGLAEALELHFASPEDLPRLSQAGDVCLFYNEHYPQFRSACTDAIQRGCATLYVPDGITEWRSSWESEYIAEALRPILCHKAAAIGHSQARIFDSWGNASKTEVVGLPRLDHLIGRSPRHRQPDEPYRVLVMTAKRPSFTYQQHMLAGQSLRDLKQWFEEHPTFNGVKVEPIWRVHAGISEEVGVSNQLNDLTGADLATALYAVDAVVTTPSTTMLEAMLQGVPVALLDYNNCPHYIPAAWRITAASHFAQVLPELLQPGGAKMLYQDFILHDALECRTPAAPRLVDLIEAMRRITHDCLAQNLPPRFPARILTAAGSSESSGQAPQAVCEEYQQRISQLTRNLDRKQEIIDAQQLELASYRGKFDRLRRHPVTRLALNFRKSLRMLRQK